MLWLVKNVQNNMSKSEIYNPQTLTKMTFCDRLYQWLSKRLPWRLIWFCVIRALGIYNSYRKLYPNTFNMPSSGLTVIELIHRLDEKRFDEWE